MRTGFPRQSTEWDCVPKAFECALLALFGRRGVPVPAMRAVYRRSIDLDDGTSRRAIAAVCAGLARSPDLSVRRLRGEGASPQGVLSAVRGGGAAVLPVWLECDDGWYPHAVAAVGAEGRRVLVADPYSRSSCRAVTPRAIGSVMDRGLFLPVVLDRVQGQRISPGTSSCSRCGPLSGSCERGPGPPPRPRSAGT